MEKERAKERERKCKTITKTVAFCLAAAAVVFSSNSATQTQQSGFALNKEVEFLGALTTASCCCHSLSSQPSTAHTHMHTGTYGQARACINTHTWPQYADTHLQTFWRAPTHTQARELESMGSRVTPAPCFIKGAVTIGLLLLWWLPGYSKTECAGLMLVHSSSFFTWWQGRQT